MQGTSYIPGYYNREDHDVGASGSLRQLLDNGVSYKNGMAYNALVVVMFNKEILRQTMLKHEAIFRSQVQELHRLYTRQRELMDETKMRKLSQCKLQKQNSESDLFLSQMQCTTSQNALQSPSRLFLNTTDSKPSAQGVMNLQGPSTFVSKKSMHAGSDIYLEGNYLEENKVSPSKSHKSRKRMLDLELPAEEYIDSEEGEDFGEENSVVPPVEYDLSNSISESLPKIKLETIDEPSSILSYSKSSYLFDLNEPIQLDESATPHSTSLGDSNTSCLDFIHHEQDLPGKSLKSCLQIEEITCTILEKKGNEGSASISGPQVSFAGKSLISCDYGTSMGNGFAKRDYELIDNNQQSVFSSCVTNSYSLAPFLNEVKTEESNSVSSQRTSCRNSREIPIAIQALPCFNAPEFLQTLRSSPKNCGIKRKYTHLMENPSCSRSLGSIATHRTRNSHKNNAADNHTVVRFNKDSKHGKLSADVDLNVLPQSHLPVSEENIWCVDGENLFGDSQGQFERSRKPDYDGESVRPPSLTKIPDQFSALTSNTSQTNSSQDKGILNPEKAEAISSILAYDSSEESETYGKEDFVIADKIGEEWSKFNICIHVDDSIREHPVSTAETQMIDKMVIGINPEAPIIPNNQEQSPPIEEYDDNQIEMPLHLSKQKTGDPNMDFDRIAAETIISISSSGDRQCLRTAPSGLVEATSDCLNWFAEIVSPVTGYLENEFQRLLNDAPGVDSNVVPPGGMWQLTGTKIEDHCLETANKKNKKVPGILLSSQRQSGQARKARQRKQFQSGLLRVSSSSSGDVTDNLQPVERLRTAADKTTGTVPSRKNVGGNCHGRGSKQSKTVCSNLMKRSLRSLLKQHSRETECSFLLRCLHGWGKKNSRQKSRRARASNQFSFR